MADEFVPSKDSVGVRVMLRLGNLIDHEDVTVEEALNSLADLKKTDPQNYAEVIATMKVAEDEVEKIIAERMDVRHG